MKKLLMFAAAVACATIASESAVRWGVFSGTPLDYVTEGQEGLQNGAIYLCYVTDSTKNIAETFKSATTFGTSTIEAAGLKVFRSDSLTDGAFYSANETITSTDGKQTAQNFYVVAIGSDGNSAAVSQAFSKTLNNAGTPVIINPAESTFAYYTAPEPCTVALLMLGMGALALRRKQR